MTLLQPSFRGRLRLFFAVIVVIPMIAVGIVLFSLLDAGDNFKLDSTLAEAQKGAQNLFTDARGNAMSALAPIQRDTRLATAIDNGDRAAVQRRITALADEIDAQWIELDVEGVGRFQTGTPEAIARSRSPLQDASNRPIGQITVSVTSASSYAEDVARVLEVGTRVDRGKDVLASTSRAAANARMPATNGQDIALGAREFRTTRFLAAEPEGLPTTVRLFTPVPAHGRGATLIIVGLTLAFLALALVFAVTVERTLKAEVGRLLTAAQRLGRGDFSISVPTEGNDEFAALGKEFNSMARELEARLEDLRRERGRLQEAIRRVGESFARGLDREGVLEIVVQTAVDGVGGVCGRATMRRRADAPMEEVTRAGDPEIFHRALHAAEAAVMDAGEVAEIQLGGASAMAAPLSATEAGDRVLAIVSVARGDRPFAPSERELFAYLTSQAAVSVENVDLHETVQRQAVTDELTGLFNHRRFQEVMAAEVERARRYDAEMGLIMLDIDNFKRVNDTYGHLQGDMVLREVARVLRQSAREIDEPARYGGEEMAVALPQTDLDGAYRFAERVRKRIEALELPLLDGDGVLRVTASFGAASLSSAPQSDKEGLVAAADAALYRAKRSGKNRTVKAE
ncbi:MAG TPA: diguanylate cyclase [Solirubrobacter sp.]|nr:diguanylate cyclase [Solirubrobacter sp.]